MARRSDRRLIEELLATHDVRLMEAFLASVADLRDNITLRVVVERLERGDVNGAINAMQLDADAFSRLELAIAEAYNAGGAATVAALPRLIDPDGNRVVFRFGVRNLAAESWLRDHSSMLVTRIIDDQREAIRMALSESLMQGRNPRAAALDVVGRISRSSNRREGGIIGLTSAQERYVATARADLLSGEADRLRHYLTLGRRDKRFDRTVMKALRDGTALDAETVARITGRYSDRLLELRGEMLARTETMTALSKARDDAIRQQIDAGKVEAQDITKIWRSASDGRVRHTHKALHGQSVPMEGTFQSPSGAMLKHPGDPSAPASETIGCRCFMEYRVDYFASIVRREAAA